MIRAVYRDGAIQPLDDVPAEWREGIKLEVRELEDDQTDAESDNWLAELNAAASKIPSYLHEELARALEEIEAESKEFARREMERSE
jgi:predicted DNA-binding antitoxin AbrB/MazE fold protein